MTSIPPAPDHLTTAVDHAHVADLETCLDLINTIELTDGVPEDRLQTAGDAIAWLSERSLGHEQALRDAAGRGRTDAAWLARVHETRTALREVWDAAVEGHPVAQDAVEMLNRVLAHAPQTQLQAAIAGVAVGHRHDRDATAEALARVAQPLVAAIAAGETGRFRVCANDGCRWVFEDTSRGGRRRWCDMSSCGNRAKVRRYRSRHKDGGDAGDVAGADPVPGTPGS